MGPLRVALLCHYPAVGAPPAGGVWAVGRNLAAGLVAAGADVHVLSYRGYEGGPSSRTLLQGRLTIHWLTGPASARLPAQLACVSHLEAKLNEVQPDAVTAHSPEYALAALRTGYPTALTVHGIVRQELRTLRGWRGRLSLLVEVGQDWWVARRVRHIVAISQYVIDQYRHRTKARFIRIDVPIADVFFQTPARSPEPNTVLLVGGMNERKDPLLLLQALALLRPRIGDVRLRIAGRPPKGEFGSRVQHMIRAEQLEDHVEFLGPLTQPELAEAYVSSAVTVLSSRQETSPAVLMEAMAARRPAVATDVGGVREIIAHGESGLVVPRNNATALAWGLEQVLRDPALASWMGQRGWELAQERYRRDRVGRRYVELLASLAAEDA